MNVRIATRARTVQTTQEIISSFARRTRSVGDSRFVPVSSSSDLSDTPPYNEVSQSSNGRTTHVEETASSLPDPHANSRLAISKKMFTCTHEGCGHTFGQKGHLKRHVDNVHSSHHQEVERFRCSYTGCKQSFGKNGHRERHQNTHHKGGELYTCPYCQLKQRRKDHSQGHQLICKKSPKRKLEFLCPHGNA